jgi:hypothetical protein
MNKKLGIIIIVLLIILYITKNISIKENFNSPSSLLNNIVNTNIYNMRVYYKNHPIHQYRKDLPYKIKNIISRIIYG